MPDIEKSRADLAIALRLAARFGLHEGIDNHFSLALSDGTFLVNRWSVHWSRMRPADILQVDGAGELVSGEGQVEKTAFCIHSAIHQRNPTAQAVLHTHMVYTTALSCTSGRLEWVSQNALRFYGRIAYDEHYAGLAMDASEGERLAGCLGDKSVLLLRNHGVIVAGASLAKGFSDLYFLERAIQVQMLARASGYPMREIPAALVDSTAQQMREIGDHQDHFDALKLLLDASS